jgi:hypothetical protein
LECSNFVLAKMGGHKMIGHSFLVCFYVVYGDAESPPILPSVGMPEPSLHFQIFWYFQILLYKKAFTRIP